MRSTGNDIVALALVNKQRTGQFRFYSKILSASEQELYHWPETQQLPFESYVWLLWSVKESAYKYLKRLDSALIFSPTNIIIQHIVIPSVSADEPAAAQWESTAEDDNLYCGKVVCGLHTLYFRAKINEAWIATVVNDDECFDDVCWGVKLINNAGYKYQSQGARLALINKLSSFLSGSLRIEKSPVGYPVVINNDEETGVPASLAHDGFFVAYSFLLHPEYVCD